MGPQNSASVASAKDAGLQLCCLHMQDIGRGTAPPNRVVVVDTMVPVAGTVVEEAVLEARLSRSPAASTAMVPVEVQGAGPTTAGVEARATATNVANQVNRKAGI